MMQNRSPGPFNFMVPLILFLFVVGGLIAANFMNPILAFAVLALAMVGMMLIGQPRLLLWGSLLFFTVRPLLSLYVGKGLSLADEAIYVACALIFFGNFIFNRFTLSQAERRWISVFVGLITLIVLSGLIHAVPLINIAQFTKAYLGFGFVFLLATKVLSGRDAKKFIIAASIFILVQVVLNIGWMFRINPLRNVRWNLSDFGTGTLGAADHVSYLIIFFMLILYGIFNERELVKKRAIVILLLSISAVGFYITYTMHAYFLLATAFVAFYLLNFSSIQNKALPIVLAVGVIPIFFLLNNLTASETHGSRFDQFDKENLRYRFEMLIEGNKAESYVNSFWLLPNEQTVNWFVGAGPGQYMSSTALVRPTALTYKYMGEFYLTQSGQKDMMSGSISQSPIVGVCMLFGELGALGFFGYLALYLIPVFRVMKQLSLGKYPMVYQRVLAQAYVPMALVFIGINMIRDAWFLGFYVFPIWIWTAIVWNPLEEPADESQVGENKLDVSAI